MTVETEITIVENLDIFRANGFDFEVRPEHESPQLLSQSPRLLLRTIPFSKNTTFGIDDINQLSDILRHSPGVMTRLPKIIKMFASRACRSAVMIGTALDHSKMRKIVSNMETLNNPWACPHGRPTMRHVIDLSPLQHTCVTTYAANLSKMHNKGE